uniref:Uncharacterized protein n=1 Tax=Vespula pensylvanica TaxID=30213 RepID=A0A834P456_VESPE|nr:hypothetical protein H0235_007041 [Vespula pensylvanica]
MCMLLSGMAVTGRRVHLSVSSGKLSITNAPNLRFYYVPIRTRWRPPKRVLERGRNPANTRLTIADDDNEDDNDDDDDDDVDDVRGFSTPVFPPPRPPPSVAKAAASTSSTRANFPLSTMRKVSTSVHVSPLALEKLIL